LQTHGKPLRNLFFRHGKSDFIIANVSKNVNKTGDFSRRFSARRIAFSPPEYYNGKVLNSIKEK